MLKAPSVHFLLVLYLLALAFVLGMGWPWPHDPDIWWHLKTGEWIVAHGAVPWTDPFGASTQDVRWIAYSWLAEVLFYTVDRVDPVLGLRLLQGIVGAATTGILYFHARAVSDSSRLALILAMLFLVPVMAWAARPQIFSFLFVALTMFILWRGEHKNRRAWWILPALFALWANIHIYFIVGLGLMLLVIGAPWMRWLRASRPAAQRPPVAGLAVLALCALAPLLNPYGYHLYVEAFALAAHGSAGWAADTIRELASPSFHDWPMKVFFVWIGLGFLALVLSRKRPDALTLVLFAGLLYQALLHRRNIPYFIIVMLPIFAQHLAQLPGARWQKFVAVGGPALAWKEIPPTRAIFHWLLALWLAGAMMIPPQRMQNLSQADLAEQRDSFGLRGAVQYLIQQHPPGPLYHSLNWGGYLIYSLTPAYKVYIDGRTQLYESAFWEAHNDVRRGKPDWYAKLSASGARTVLWQKEEPLASLLRLKPEWGLVYEDEKAAIFVKRDQAR